MKLFDDDSNGNVTEESCASLVMETIPIAMGTLKAEMRRHRPADMTVPQFRTLLFLQRHAGASLSTVAEFHGLTLSTVSKLVDGLVKRRLITRESSATDRRRVILTLTEYGQTTLQTVHQNAQAQMVKSLSGLAEEERQVIKQAMETLHRVLKRTAVNFE